VTLNAPGTPLLPPQGASDRDIAKAVNQALQGKINSVFTVTLTHDAASTTVNDPRIGSNTAIILFPQTAHAAAEMGNGTLYIDPANYTLKTSFVITHANNAQTDRTFSVVILG
jgi:hypothetical protein